MDIEIVKKVLELIRGNEAISLKIMLSEQSELLQYEFAGETNWLHKAATFDSPNSLEVLIEYFDIESTDRFGRTPLSKSLTIGKVEATKSLIKLGANVNHGGEHSPLSCAVYSKNKELLKLLIDNGANNERTDELVRYGKGQGYTDLAEDLAEFNYTPLAQDCFKDKLVEQYGALRAVELSGKSYQLYFKKVKNNFVVVSENMNEHADIIFDLQHLELSSVEQVFSELTPWLLDWFYVLTQVPIDPTQRFMIIEKDCESTPYQGLLLLFDEQIAFNGNLHNIYRMIPLHASEIAFERAQGMEALIHKLDEKRLNPAIVSHRRDIVG